MNLLVAPSPDVACHSHSTVKYNAHAKPAGRARTGGQQANGVVHIMWFEYAQNSTSFLEHADHSFCKASIV